MLHGITPSTTTLNTKTDPYASAKAGQVTKPPRHARQKTYILGISPGFGFVVFVFWVYVAGDQTRLVGLVSCLMGLWWFLTLPRSLVRSTISVA